jgi:hypothetical protein
VMWLLSRMRSATANERQPVHPPSAANISSIRTGVFAGEGTNQPDFTIPYLTVVPNCIGLTSIRVLPLQGTAFLNAATLSEKFGRTYRPGRCPVPTDEGRSVGGFV